MVMNTLMRISEGMIMMAIGMVTVIMMTTSLRWDSCCR